MCPLRVTWIAVGMPENPHCVDTHSKPVIERVWEIYAEAERRTGGRATILEWDDDIPSFEMTFAELQKAAPFKNAGKAAGGRAPKRPARSKAVA